MLNFMTFRRAFHPEKPQKAISREAVVHLLVLTCFLFVYKAHVSLPCKIRAGILEWLSRLAF